MTLGQVSGYDFEFGAIPAGLSDRLPRVAMVAGTRAYFRRAAIEGLYGHAPKRDVDRRSTRNLELRPRLRVIIANPVKINWGRACSSERNDGLVMVDIRGLVRSCEVRVAGTPSYCPSIFVFE